MAQVYKPFVRETSTITGPGDIDLAGAMFGSIAFADVMATGDTADIAIAYGGAREECRVTMQSNGKLARGTCYLSKHANGVVD